MAHARNFLDSVKGRNNEILPGMGRQSRTVLQTKTSAIKLLSYAYRPPY